MSTLSHATNGVIPGEPPVRPEYEIDLKPFNHETNSQIVLEKKRPLWQRLWHIESIRKTVILLVLAFIWELVGRITANDLLLPTFVQTFHAFTEGIASGELFDRVSVSFGVLLQGYALGIVLAFLLTSVAVSTQLGRDILSTFTAMFNPLPAIALLPLALMWFGLGNGSLVFVLVHSVLWPLALNTFAGFQGVPATLRMAGRNYGLSGMAYVMQILVPAALPSILSGLKVGWAFAWRTLIAAELVFGASSGEGGLGWYI
ncbi:MAG: ABC transporter permease, partial [Alcaligenaceae bacterium]|nr:ABC transporter permease [Alcaligenaceae bacterium]